tara:strand:+ start:80 stop:1087 length:1008 start_codon:yes stop_codon:yes gene_type:complete
MARKEPVVDRRGLPKEKLPDGATGVAGRVNPEAIVPRTKTPAEKHNRHGNVMTSTGPYRPGGIASIPPGTGQATWHLTAGPLSCLPEPVPEVNKKGVPNYVDPNMILDASTMIVTEKGNIQEDCNLAQGTNRGRDGLAQILMKTDFAAMVGRQGVNIITSPDPRNSIGPDAGVQDICLIAGNDDTRLQPVVLGDDLRIFLNNKLVPLINVLLSQVNVLVSENVQINSVLSSHTHPIPSMTTNIPIAEVSTTTITPGAGPGRGFGTTTPQVVKSDPGFFTGTSAALQAMAKKSSIELQPTKTNVLMSTNSLTMASYNHLKLNNTPGYLFSRNVKAT